MSQSTSLKEVYAGCIIRLNNIYSDVRFADGKVNFSDIVYYSVLFSFKNFHHENYNYAKFKSKEMQTCFYYTIT